MLSESDIRLAVECLVAVARPSKAIVFGSYARGEADEGSDLGLLVVERELEEKLPESVRLRGANGRCAGLRGNLLLCSEAEFERRSGVPGTAHYWARKAGRVAYDMGH